MTLPIENVITSAKGRLDPIMGTGRYSFGFVVDMAMVTLLHHRNLLRVVEEIGILEEKAVIASSTKMASCFKGKRLRGYWHKHYTDASLMPQNVLNEMRLDHTIMRVLAPHMGQYLTAGVLGELTKAIVQDNYLRRKRESRLTGEWIVYSKTGSHNYYLTLAEHRESDASTAERIHRYEAIDRQTGWDSRRGHGIDFLKPE